MRMLIEDIITTADSISSAIPSALYPASNLLHPIVARRYQGYGNADIITIDFSSDQEINCIFFSLNNFSSFSAVLKDSGGGTLGTINITSFPQTGRAYFSTVSGVRQIVLNVATASTKVYLGCFRAGLYYETRNFLNAYALGLKNNSLHRKTKLGYSTDTHFTPLKSYRLNFREAQKDEADEINRLYTLNGSKPIFIDLTHGNSDYISPLYATIEKAPDPTKADRRYSYKLDIEEAR